MMEEVSEIRSKLREQRDAADEGLRDSTWLTMLVMSVLLLNTLRRGLQETTSSHVRELQLEGCPTWMSRAYTSCLTAEALGLGERRCIRTHHTLAERHGRNREKCNLYHVRRKHGR
jgi:hypothetical protein